MPVKVVFRNSFEYYQEKIVKPDDGKPLEVREKVMKSHVISEGQKHTNPDREPLILDFGF